MNFNHFGRRTDFGMLEMDIAPIMSTIKKKRSVLTITTI